MTAPTVLVGTWGDGLHVLTGERRHQELPGRSVRGLTADGEGGSLAIVDGHELCRRTSDGKWSTIATSQFPLACAVVVGEVVYVGTDDARLLRVGSGGKMERLDGFDRVAGRDTWYAGSAIVDGQVVGPPLGVRSLTATCDGAVLLANVHVGGIPRSLDGGESWEPTIHIESDVHQVCAHPSQAHVVIAASGIGLCISRDGGATWSVEQSGLHGAHCTAVAFWGADLLVSAATDHFASRGALYRRSLEESGALQPVAGLPGWTEGIVDTDGLAARGSVLAAADRAGNLYVSGDYGRTWSRYEARLPSPSSLLIA